MAAEPTIQHYLSRYQELKAEKDPWLAHYQALAEVFLTRKAEFTNDITPGEFLQDNVFDNTAQFAAQTAASVFLSMLWPDSARTFVIRPVRRLRDQPGVEAYFKFVTEEMRTAMDNPRAGLGLALMEHFLEQQVFGTSGLGVFEGPEDDSSLPVVFDAWGIKTMLISESAQGFVDTVYFVRTRTARQIVQEYGQAPDKIAKKVWECYNAGKLEEKFEILHVLEPKIAQKGKIGVAAMKTRTVHIDMKNKVIMRTGGYQEMPVFIARMIKTIDEVYARSPAMTALPDAQSLNALTEGVIVAVEKQLDPPLGILDDGRLGGGVVDTSASALNVFNSSGRIGAEKPIFPLFTVGDIVGAEKQQERFEKKIMQAFSLDRLLDLNNATQMTAYETSIRDRMRGQSLGALFAREIAEVFTPAIERTFNVLYRSGRLGVERAGTFGKIQKLWSKILGTDDVIVPDVIVKAAEAGLDIFEIEYISPAQRFMQSEKLQGILSVKDFLLEVGQIVPGMLDNVDPDILFRHLANFAGAPSDVVRTKDAVTDLRAAMAQQQAAATQLQAAKETSEIGRNVSQSVAALGGGKKE